MSEEHATARVDAASALAALGGRSVVLVGLMGAGKTTVGKRLATLLDLPFVDADQEIEAAAGMSIVEMFERHGEAYFRDGERRVITRLLGEGPSVLSTGGGAFMDAGTRETIARSGVAVWLRGDIELLLKRVARRTTRPLLKPEPRAALERLIAERYPTYAKADVTVDSRDVPHDVIVDDIVAELAKRA